MPKEKKTNIIWTEEGSVSSKTPCYETRSFPVDWIQENCSSAYDYLHYFAQMNLLIIFSNRAYCMGIKKGMTHQILVASLCMLLLES